eukprot:TRINITY_DN6002_c0_g1_i1.p2 TRINITY_DN6002_c0_g1~~TRINITY_DN6002_c0_g1_i1.p2  ORF type:complete len:327 (+),score=131.20 TRINITY_DN6002_c0_g1_i1:105-1085(+)
MAKAAAQKPAQKQAPQKRERRVRRDEGSHTRSFVTGTFFVAFFTGLLQVASWGSGSRVNVLGEVMPRILVTLAILYVAHFAYLRRTLSPYYIAHTVVNGAICVFAFNDLWWVMTDPAEALRAQVAFGGTLPLELCAALHFYHVFAYTDLRFVDYLHHVLMVFICMPIFYAAEYGPLQNYSMFFISGLPGGVDYAMLAFVRSGKLRKITEKKWNTSLNVWLRSPFLIGSVVLSHVQIGLLRDVLSAGQVVCRLGCQALVFWNAMYFTESVVGDYYRLSLKRGKIALYHDLGESSEGESDEVGGGMRVTERAVSATNMSPRSSREKFG